MRALHERAWALRHNVTYTDGLYVALAVDVGGQLLTDDHRLANATLPVAVLRLPQTRSTCTSGPQGRTGALEEAGVVEGVGGVGGVGGGVDGAGARVAAAEEELLDDGERDTA